LHEKASWGGDPTPVKKWALFGGGAGKRMTENLENAVVMRFAL